MIREADKSDIRQIQCVRNSVTENILSDPGKITDDMCEDYILRRGKGWVYEVDEKIIGFAIVDLQESNIWALFVDPSFESKGCGSALQKQMLYWYFEQNKKFVWLSTSPNTRAAKYYHMQGWGKTETLQNGELKYEKSASTWLQLQK